MKKIRIIALLIVIALLIMGGIIGVNKYTDTRKKTELLENKVKEFASNSSIKVSDYVMCNEDDIIGWFLYEKNEEIHINVLHYAITKGNHAEAIWKDMKIDKDYPIGVDGKFESTKKVGENIINTKYITKEGNEFDINIQYIREGSCGDYQQRIKVTDAKTDKVIATTLLEDY